MLSSFIPHEEQLLPVMLLPLNTDNMLVPEVMVMQVCSEQSIEVVEQSPEWFVGFTQWRGFKLPIVSFEALNGAMPVQAEDVRHLAIVKSTAEHGYLPYYAVAITDEPQLFEITGNSISLQDARPRGRAELLSVGLENQTAGIPNTEWIESHLLTYILHS